MDRDERLPTRVSKACDRCKRQKQRCDNERPCRHCVRAKTECATSAGNGVSSKKSRLRRNASSVSEAGPARTTASPSEAPESQSIPGHHHVPSTLDNPDPAIQVGVSWDLPPPPPAPLNRGSSQASSSVAQQSIRSDKHLPSFDSDSALAITRKIFRSQHSPAFIGRATSAIPGGGGRHQASGSNSSNKVPAPLVPIFDIIGIDLPTYDICNSILDVYFSAVHWFSLVIFEPKFRCRYDAIITSGLASRNDHGFLLLLLMVLIMGCWYKSREPGTRGDEMDVLRTKLLKVVQRDFMELMDEDCLEFVQLCALLGSFYLYHGKPRSSFSILGAATKTAQAMDLHRDSENRWSFEDKEERIRVWWTIYTWDRFGSITYGRPLGINDKDCNVPMPSEIVENVQFDSFAPAIQICLSPYQYRLNQVYRIASPLLEDIYGLRTSQGAEFDLRLPEMVSTATHYMLKWYQDLPTNLSFDQINDLTFSSSSADKMHHLQALSLQLTYDNLMIVMHRPLLAVRNHHSSTTESPQADNEHSDRVRETGFKRCLASALRISNIQQQKPNLFSLARTTHLVSFLGMNIFTASVVLFLCALSDTLSDTAQEAKRGLKRTLQMQKSLSNFASLSLQCSRILEDLVQLILKREMEEMLLDQSSSEDVPPTGTATHALHQHDGVARVSNSDQVASDMSHATVAREFSNPDSSNYEGSQLMQSLETLQRVFYDPSFQHSHMEPSHHRNDTAFNPAGINWAQEDVTGAHDNNATFTSVEDLGQFWLWDVENFNF